MPAGCVFCDVVAGRVAAFEVLRDDVAVAFLDKSPLFPGHTLVVPVRHVETLADLAPDEVGPYFERVQAIAAAMPEAFGADGTFVANNNVVSQSVPHLHVHVVPRTRGDGLRGFFWPRRDMQRAKRTRMPSDCAARSLRPAERQNSTSCKCNDSFRCIHVVRASLMSTACKRRVAVRRRLERDNSNIHTHEHDSIVTKRKPTNDQG